MTAQKARELTEKQIKGRLLQPLLEYVYAKVEEAAEQGRNSITHPLHEYCFDGSTHLREALERNLWGHLSAHDGYLVEHLPDPDPGDPRSTGGYTRISW